MEKIQEKIQVGMHPSLLRKFARSQYSTDPVAIWVREIGIQNAWDACKNTGRAPEISISIDVDTKARTASCLVQDNGCGMDDETFLYSYLYLGSSGKSGLNQVGGFGIASAIVLGSAKWEVWTNYIHYSSEMLERGDQLEHMPEPLRGTRVGCLIEDFNAWSWQRDVMAMLYMSDIDVAVTITIDGSLSHYDSHAGGALRKATVSNVEFERNMVSAGGTMQTKILDRLDISESAQKHMTDQGYNIYRLNGLCQFYNRSYASGRKTNLIFEVTPSVRPGTDEYPFLMNREGLTGLLKDNARTITGTYDIDTQSSVRNAMREEVERVQVLKGKLLTGKQGSMKKELPIVYSGYDASLASMEFTDQDVIDQAQAQEQKQPEPTNSQLLFVNYRDVSTEQIKKDARYLRLWRELLLMCADEDMEFGIGFEVDDMIYAHLKTHEDVHYFLLNPEHYRDTGRSKDADILAMWHLACHEVAHWDLDNHNEAWAIEEAHRSRLTCEELVAQMPELRKILTGRRRT